MSNKGHCAACDEEMEVGSTVYDVTANGEDLRFCSEACLAQAELRGDVEVHRTEVEFDDLDEDGEIMERIRDEEQAERDYLEREYFRSR